MIDTLNLSRLLNPELSGGHSLGAWGQRLGYPKTEFKDFDGGWTQAMEDYCVQDTLVTAKLYEHLIKQLDTHGFSQDCRELEFQFQSVIAKQERKGWKFDMQGAMLLHSNLSVEKAKIEEEMQRVFEPTIIQLKTKQKIIPFNPGSRQQVADRLMKRGWKPKQKTETGQVVVNEKTLEACPIPEAKLIARYMMLVKRTSQIDQWIEAAKEDGRVHGKVITNGAVSSRCTHHSPNVAQVPAVKKEFGYECRSLFTVGPGMKQVGADASGLELRMLAHYMRDESYVLTVTTGSSANGTDIHTVNMRAAGLQNRDQAKTFIYALLYGAGAAKIGSIVGGSAREGTKLIDTFMRNLPALQRLKQKVARYATKGYVPGLDGRKIWVRSEHSALNTLLQGNGAIVLKKACVILDSELKRNRIYDVFVGNIHDEWQMEVPEDAAELAGRIAVQSIREAGEFYDLFCPLDGEFKIGNNWAETH